MDLPRDLFSANCLDKLTVCWGVVADEIHLIGNKNENVVRLSAVTANEVTVELGSGTDVLFICSGSDIDTLQVDMGPNGQRNRHSVAREGLGIIHSEIDHLFADMGPGEDSVVLQGSNFHDVVDVDGGTGNHDQLLLDNSTLPLDANIEGFEV